MVLDGTYESFTYKLYFTNVSPQRILSNIIHINPIYICLQNTFYILFFLALCLQNDGSNGGIPPVYHYSSQPAPGEDYTILRFLASLFITQTIHNICVILKGILVQIHQDNPNNIYNESKPVTNPLVNEKKFWAFHYLRGI